MGEDRTVIAEGRPEADWQSARLRGHPLGAWRRGSMEGSGQGVPFAKQVLATPGRLGRLGRLGTCLGFFVGFLDVKGLLDWDETFGDGSFASARMAVRVSGKPNAGKIRSG